MKKRGFTLIELLAVIVVLAIIALIATPIVMNTIKNSKKGAAERGAENYIKQVETTIAEKRLENTPLSDGTYTIDENGNLTGNGLTEPITIEMNGTKPSSGSIIISEGRVTNDSIIGFKDYDVKYNISKKRYEAIEKGSTPQVELLCKNYTGADLSNLVYGDKFVCELGDGVKNIFYVLETSEDNISLIMNANIGTDGKVVTSESTDKGYVAWCKSGNDNSCNGDNAIEVLAQRTSSWNKITNKSMITLPSAEQIATASGKTFDASSTSSISGLSTWLYENSYGYWTSTASPYESPSYAFSVSGSQGLLDTGISDFVSVDNSNSLGIRPVITISKKAVAYGEEKETVYFNVTTGNKCSSTDYTTSQSNEGVNSGCMKFYKLNDDGNYVNLLLDHNIEKAYWECYDISTTDGPGKKDKELMKVLDKNTSTWLGTITPKNYTYGSYTIDYSNYKARLVTKEEIETAKRTSDYSEWLGTDYWTATADDEVYFVDNGELSTYGCCAYKYLRPVITVLKSQLN